MSTVILRKLETMAFNLKFGPSSSGLHVTWSPTENGPTSVVIISLKNESPSAATQTTLETLSSSSLEDSICSTKTLAAVVSANIPGEPTQRSQVTQPLGVSSEEGKSATAEQGKPDTPKDNATRLDDGLPVQLGSSN